MTEVNPTPTREPGVVPGGGQLASAPRFLRDTAAAPCLADTLDQARRQHEGIKLALDKLISDAQLLRALM